MTRRKKIALTTTDFDKELAEEIERASSEAIRHIRERMRVNVDRAVRDAISQKIQEMAAAHVAKSLAPMFDEVSKLVAKEMLSKVTSDLVFTTLQLMIEDKHSAWHNSVKSLRNAVDAGVEQAVFNAVYNFPGE